MPGPNEVLASLFAAWRLFLGRPDAMRLFDLSFGGFWRSFLAVVYLVPIYVPYILSERRLMILNSGLDEALFPMGAFFAVRTLALVVDWLTFPLLMLAVARPLGFSRGIVAYIVAHNWGGVLFTLPIALPAILYGYGLMPGTIAATFTFIGLGLLVRYLYMIARAALQASIGQSVAIVLTEILLSFVLAEQFSRIFGF